MSNQTFIKRILYLALLYQIFLFGMHYKGYAHASLVYFSFNIYIFLDVTCRQDFRTPAIDKLIVCYCICSAMLYIAIQHSCVSHIPWYSALIEASAISMMLVLKR